MFNIQICIGGIFLVITCIMLVMFLHGNLYHIDPDISIAIMTGLSSVGIGLIVVGVIKSRRQRTIVSKTI